MEAVPYDGFPAPTEAIGRGVRGQVKTVHRWAGENQAHHILAYVTAWCVEERLSRSVVTRVHTVSYAMAATQHLVSVLAVQLRRC